MGVRRCSHPERGYTYPHHNSLKDMVNNVPAVSEEEAFEHACRTWFEAPGRRAADELHSLPSVERERVWADLTGKPEICQAAAFPQEDTGRVQQAFSDLRQLLLQSPLEPLRSALQLQPEYICNPNYLIRFLRAKNFDISLALECLNRHLKMKESLFGRACLTRDICLGDLSDDDHQCLERGVYQYLSETDRAGRTVSFLNFADPYYSNETMQSVVSVYGSTGRPVHSFCNQFPWLVSHVSFPTFVTASDHVLFEYRRHRIGKCSTTGDRPSGILPSKISSRRTGSRIDSHVRPDD